MARVTEDTIVGQIRALDPGQSFSRSKRLTLEEAANEMTPTEALAKLRNMVNQAVGRLRKEIPGSNFRVESMVGFTDNKQAVLATVAATRFDGEDDEEQDI